MASVTKEPPLNKTSSQKSGLLATKALVHILGDSTAQTYMTKREKPPNIFVYIVQHKQLFINPKQH